MILAMAINWDEETTAKYVVFKQAQWEAFGAEAVPLTDAVVIRLKDPFAATALYSYANTIMSMLELMKEDLSEEEQDRMLGIADYFHQQAVESSKIKDKRLPD